MSYTILTPAKEIKSDQPISDKGKAFVDKSRSIINAIVNKDQDKRLLVILGPCSIHCYESAIEYANHVSNWRKKFGNKIELVMRCYFEKPRTRGGWKGLIYDPWIDGSNDISSGLKISRRILLDIIEKEVPVAHELLDPTSPIYFDDLICWGAIGARTVESQIHRQLASNMPYAVGFKNSTNGNIDVAIDAICSSSDPHTYISVDYNNAVVRVESLGNNAGHLILRGGAKPNYSSEIVHKSYQSCKLAGFEKGIVIDCSHGNSNKDYNKQSEVVEYLINSKMFSSGCISGLMLESNLKAGKQAPAPLATLEYGVSITDGCIGIIETEELLEKIHGAI